ncbi:MAG: hypothetical protein HYU36_04120 [Planctomycetes bacterium]|nr:hypothetical protein [Planctomycetota bacterium]
MNFPVEANPESHALYLELCGRASAIEDDLRRVRLGTGLCWIVGWVIGPFLTAILVDRLLPLPDLVRAAVTLACAATLLYGVARHLFLSAFQKLSTETCAAIIEGGIPELRTSLITGIQIYEDLESERPRFDRQMVEATLRHAAQLARRFDFRSVVETAELRHRAAVAGLVLLASLIYAATDFPGLLSQLRRFFTAFGRVQEEWVTGPRRSISVKVLPDGKTTLLRGSSVTLEATLVGFRSSSVTLQVRSEKGKEEDMDLPTESDGTARHTWPGLEESFEASFRAGEVASETVAIKVVERPEVVNIQLENIYPTYVRRPPLRLPRSSGEITTLKGSYVVLTIEANKNLRAGNLEILQGSPMPLTVGGRFARVVIPVERTTEYRIHLTDEDGFENENPQVRIIQMVIDQDPQVRFVNLGIEPEGEAIWNEGVASGKSLDVESRDDYGIRKLILHYDIEAVVKDVAIEPVRDKEKVRSFSLPLQSWTGSIARVSELGLRIGARLTFWAEVQDWYDLGEDGKPHSARTPVFRLVVVGQEESWEDLGYKPDENINFSLYEEMQRTSRGGRQKPPRESITREERPEMPSIQLDVSYGHEDVPVEYQRAWKAYTGSLME